jgi:hypothetical protein
MWPVAMLIVANGFPVCFGNHGGDVDGESIDKSDKLSRDDQPMKTSMFFEGNIDVTIRLDEGFLRYLCGPRRIVTIHSPPVPLALSDAKSGVPEMTNNVATSKGF